jgi:hypothetical protein
VSDVKKDSFSEIKAAIKEEREYIGKSFDDTSRIPPEDLKKYIVFATQDEINKIRTTSLGTQQQAKLLMIIKEKKDVLFPQFHSPDSQPLKDDLDHAIEEFVRVLLNTSPTCLSERNAHINRSILEDILAENSKQDRDIVRIEVSSFLEGANHISPNGRMGG